MAMLSASQRVMLDRRIAEEALIALDPPFERPDWYWQLDGFCYMPIAFVMDGHGEIAPSWVPADEIDWTKAAAIRLETNLGLRLDLDEIGEDEVYY